MLPILQFNGLSLIQVAASLAKPFNIDVVNAGAPSSVIPGVQPDHGETVIEVLNKMLGQQQALAYDDPKGRLVIGGIGPTRAHTALVLGKTLFPVIPKRASGSDFPRIRSPASEQVTIMTLVLRPLLHFGLKPPMQA